MSLLARFSRFITVVSGFNSFVWGLNSNAWALIAVSWLSFENKQLLKAGEYIVFE